MFQSNIRSGSDLAATTFVGMLAALFIGGFTAGIVVVVALVNGFVLSKIWAWCLLAVFPNLPPLGIPQSIAIALVVSWLTNHSFETKKDERESLPLWHILLMWIVLRPGATLLFAYCLTHWL